MSHNFPPTSFQHSYHVWRRAQITRLIILQYALFSCNFLLLKSKSFPWHSGIKPPKSCLFLNVSVSRITKEKTARKFRDVCDRTILLFHLYSKKEDTIFFPERYVRILPAPAFQLSILLLFRTALCSVIYISGRICTFIPLTISVLLDADCELPCVRVESRRHPVVAHCRGAWGWQCQLIISWHAIESFRQVCRSLQDDFLYNKQHCI